MISSLFIGIILMYLILIGAFVFGFDQVADFELNDISPKSKFTVVIPFRNEAKNLPSLLHSIAKLNYPKSHFEVYLVDDLSNDNSLTVIEDFIRSNMNDMSHIKVLSNDQKSGAPKKDAIATAISKSNYDWVITTDADCRLPIFWLDAYDEFIQSQEVNCIIGPVGYTYRNTFFQKFQALENLSLQAATIGGFGLNRPFMSNGANLAYKKAAFQQVDGFQGNDDIASGDDLFILNKLLRLDKKSVAYLKSEKARILTLPQRNWYELTHQHVRWASKTKHIKDWFLKLVGFLIFLANLVTVLLVPLTLIQLISLKTAVLLFIIKFCIDFLLLFKSCRFFKEEQLFFSYAPCSVVYPFFNVYSGILSFYKPYEWKGRQYKT